MDDLLSLVRWLLLGGFVILGVYLFIAGIKQVIADISNKSGRAKIFLLSYIVLATFAFGYFIGKIGQDNRDERIESLQDSIRIQNDTLEWLKFIHTRYSKLKEDKVINLRDRMHRCKSIMDSTKYLREQKYIIDNELSSAEDKELWQLQNGDMIGE